MLPTRYVVLLTDGSEILRYVMKATTKNYRVRTPAIFASFPRTQVGGQLHT